MVTNLHDAYWPNRLSPASLNTLALRLAGPQASHSPLRDTVHYYYYFCYENTHMCQMLA